LDVNCHLTPNAVVLRNEVLFLRHCGALRYVTKYCAPAALG